MLVCIQAYHWEAKRMVENEQSFGEYLRQLIRDSGITQHKFYTELGIRKPYFYDILAGRTNPPPYPLQLKAMEILQASNETRERFFDLAAKGRNELPADIARYIDENPDALKSIREKMKLASCQ
ncbi:hypothetical protein C1O51_08805 [Akkermansia muciniphila]|nr:helix-turn-helix transcriptional regulator [Akkermansia muciniphila]MCL6685634.1 helix-turn-helix domain-containing protein [Akkermansia muciniphila]QAA53282.1 hypothetical protein C1O50_08805 [Akkermansia muciniphila]QAA55590.1 hypothetical protein C1O51_08805 [Akkermansia muciniphila]QAA57905.1 hypothetical protein C1O54_08775 [Akkermansia muciniphila]